MAGISISGLISGLDINDIVSSLLATDQAAITRLQTSKSNLETKKTAWGDVDTRLNSLLSEVETLKESSIFNGKSVSSSDSKAVSATATGEAEVGDHEIWVKQLAQAQKIASDEQSSGALGLTGTFQVTVGGLLRSISVSATDSLEDIMAKVNDQAEGTGEVVVAAIVDRRLVITSRTSGSAGEMQFTDTDGVLRDLGVLDEDAEIKTTLKTAQDAIFNVDGIEVIRSQNSVTDVISGVTLNLNQVTDIDADGSVDSGEIITLNVTQDKSSTLSALRDFVSQYNSVMDFIATKLGKTESTKGDLYQDITLTRIQQKLKDLVSGMVSTGSSYQAVSQVGLTTGAISSGLSFDRDGKITLDEEVFTAALENDAEGVSALFTSGEGVANRLYSYLKDLTKSAAGTQASSADGVISCKEKSLTLSITDLEKQMETLNDRLEKKEEQLLSKYNAMELALAKLVQESSWLEQTITAMYGNSSLSSQ